MTNSVLDVDEQNLTPGMKQYREVKEKHPDCVVMLRMGDFFEMFYEDAVTASRELDITLTSRGQGEKRAPLAGIPFHAIEPYLGKLVKRGYKVAIVEQLEDPKKAKGLIKRGVVRIVTAGTLVESSLLTEKENNYLASIAIHNTSAALAIADISTGEFRIESFSTLSDLFASLTQNNPSEILHAHSLAVNSDIIARLKIIAPLESLDDQLYKYDAAKKRICDFFNLTSLDPFQLENQKLEVAAAASLLNYLEKTHKTKLVHLTKITRSSTKHMIIDANTFRSLEITKSLKDGSKKGTLLEVLDDTKTALGGRLLNKWLTAPLQDQIQMQDRIAAITDLKSSSLRLAQLQNTLNTIQDIERLLSKVHTAIATPKDILSLRNSLRPLPILITQLSPKTLRALRLKEIATLNTHHELVHYLTQAMRDEAPHSTREGDIFNSEFHQELSSLRNIRDHASDIITKIEEAEKKKTGINSLKVGYTRIFGYYIEIPRKNTQQIPTTYMRKQTTANAERYITSELKEMEDKVLNADEKIKELEYTLFHELLNNIKFHTSELQETAKHIAELDVLCALTSVAIKNNYHAPTLSNEKDLILTNARHPVVETLASNFISNSITLQDGHMMIITGPNMAGKSTIMRQCALIIYLAHIGSYVPATSAIIPLTDKIFSRVGAQDDLATGKSTFLVEMHETAHIVNNATANSFIILDEIGRGTSTFDGVSIAWSVAEYIHNHIRAKTMFATHYHILNNLTQTLPRIENFNIAVEENQKENSITFLHTLIPGGTDQSYGIHVAKIAGIPQQILERATQIQQTLEKDDKMVRLLKAKRLDDQKSITEF